MVARPAVPAFTSLLSIIGPDDVADTGDHKGPPRAAPPPSPLRGNYARKGLSIVLKFVDDDLSPYRLSCIIAMVVKISFHISFEDIKEGEAMAMQKHNLRPRLMIEISPELCRRIKISAAQNDLSVREYIERVLEQTVPGEANLPQREPRHVTQEAIDRLRQVREQIRQKHLDTVFTDSAEIIRQMRAQHSDYLAEL